MNVLQLWRLRQYCISHDIDDHEIDNEISYSENLQHLRSLNPEYMDDIDGERTEVWQAKITEYIFTHIFDYYRTLAEEGRGPQYMAIPQAESRETGLKKKVLDSIAQSLPSRPSQPFWGA